MRLGRTTLVCIGAGVLGFILASCSTSKKGLPNVEPGDDLGGGGMAGSSDGGGGGGGGGGEDPDGGGRPDLPTCEPPETLKELGVACGCNEECDSGSCVDGVCCSGACDGVCQACNVPGNMGTCSPVPAGLAPAVAGQCKQDDVSTCGFDGTCDGNGACRRYPNGTACEKGTCDGATVKGAKVCRDGECQMGSNVVCAPFGCDESKASCFVECSSNDECAPGQQCKNGSCGKKNLGAQCEAGSECESGFCADGVCCNTSCKEGCVSCNQPDKMGECTPVQKDKADPHGVCKDEGASSCGSSGVCDGKGGCAKYGSGVVCRPQRCEGANQISPSTCDGMGACKAGGQVACRPYSCVGNSCVNVCTDNSQCTGGNVCINGSCGKRGLGQRCASNSECGSNFCVDGVCCDGACTGQCRFCASSQAPGRCINVPANTPDPRLAAGVTESNRVCTPQARTSCGRNGMCNGNGGCQLWSNSTQCADQTCSSSTHTLSPQRLCDGFGTCRSQDAQTCSPYKCNGNSCGIACGSNNDCISPNECINGRCGLKAPGALCSGNSECGSGFCSQGVCCQTDCRGSCFSCALQGSRGLCTAVPAGGQDPAGSCKDDGASSCDRDGTCDGTGKCRLYAQGLECSPPTCSNGTATSRGTCDGSGNCNPGTTRPCGAFQCNVTGTNCYESCTSDGQCRAPRVCSNNTCGKKPNGGQCTANDECDSGKCAQGFCCNEVCDGLCKSCALTGTEGTCSNIKNGDPDLEGRCKASAPETCGNSGFCNGNGGCAKHAATVTCRNQSCAQGTSTEVQPAKCDGNGSCPAVETTPCGTFLCDPTTNSCLKNCNAAIADNLQCVSPNVCTNMSCGLKAKGDSCELDTQCVAGTKCIEGVCCSGAPAGQRTCSPCNSCKVSGSIGQCSPLPAGPEGAGACAATECGVQALCDGAGQCLQNAPAGKPCGAAMCVDGNKKQSSACNGSGTCAVVSTEECPGFRICENGACRDSCQSDDHCVGGRVCEGGQCIVPKKGLGVSCTSNDECASTFCSANKVCCTESCTDACKTCNQQGMCVNVPDNTVSAGCNANPGQPCRAGVCGADGQCKVLECNSTCSADGNSVTGSVCGGTPIPMCMAGMSSLCIAYKCSEGKCLEACTSDAQCQATHYCQMSPMPAGSQNRCLEKKMNGESCNRNENCSGGSCVNNICCSGCTPDPGNVCGNTGTCNPDGSCSKASADVVCGSSCAADTLTIQKCDGSGSCSVSTQTSCAEQTATCLEGQPAMCVPVLPPVLPVAP